MEISIRTNQEGDINGENNMEIHLICGITIGTPPVITPFCAEATPPYGTGARAGERLIHGEVVRVSFTFQ